MTNIYEAILMGKSLAQIQKEFNIDLTTLKDIASTKMDYDALSPNEREKVLHSLSLLSNKSWSILESAPLEIKVKLLDLLRRLLSDRAEILGLKSNTQEITGEIQISWKKE